MNLCIIPARGGSKRIPRKNIKLFNDFPLIAYSIKNAQNSGIFDKIIVSTDDEEIAKIAAKFGADVPFVRPKSLSDDFVGTSEVVVHAIEQMQEKCDTVCCLYATAPLINEENLKKAYEEFRKSKKEFLFSISEFSYPVQRALKNPDEISMLYPEFGSFRSQDLEKAYHDAGAFYFGSKNSWQERKAIFKPHSKGFILPRFQVCDIDTPQDWEMAELMYEILVKKKILKKL